MVNPHTMDIRIGTDAFIVYYSIIPKDVEETRRLPSIRVKEGYSLRPLNWPDSVLGPTGGTHSHQMKGGSVHEQ
jgi:hypothetical protein